MTLYVVVVDFIYVEVSNFIRQSYWVNKILLWDLANLKNFSKTFSLTQVLKHKTWDILVKNLINPFYYKIEWQDRT